MRAPMMAGGKSGKKPTISPSADLLGLQSAINDASSRAGALWLSFLTFMAYLTMTVGSVTHEMLLRQKPIKLPVLNVDLPLVAFFWLSPIFLILFHFYLYLQLSILVRKLSNYSQQLSAECGTEDEREGYRQRLDTFLVVQFLSGPAEERTGLTSRLLRLVSAISLVLAPVLLLIQFQLTFLPYHLQWVTWAHRVAVLSDLMLSWVFWTAICDRHGKITLPDLQLRRFRLWKILGKLATALIVNFRRRPISVLSSAALIVTSVFLFSYRGELIEELTPFSDFVFMHGKVDLVQGRAQSWFSNVLVVPYKKISGNDDADAVLSLRGRDLRGAVLFGADLQRADFTGANLDGAHFDGAKLMDANFGCAQLQQQSRLNWPEDGCTWLRGASFANAQLQAADLFHAHMQGAVLIKANLQGAHLDLTELQAGVLMDAQLQGATLNGANLNGTDLERANFIGARIEGASFEKAFIEGAVFDIALLRDVAIFGTKGTPGQGQGNQSAFGFYLANFDPSPIQLMQEMAPRSSGGNFRDFRPGVGDWLPPDYKGTYTTLDDVYAHAPPTPWDEILPKIKAPTGPDRLAEIRKYLISVVCDAGSAPYVTHALIENERLLAAGPEVREVINVLKQHKAECRGAAKLTEKDYQLLDDFLRRPGAKQVAGGPSADVEVNEDVSHDTVAEQR